MLVGVPSGRRGRVLAAMGEVERSLRAGLVEVGVEDPRHPDVARSFARYAEELDGRFEGGFDARRSIPAEPGELTPPAGYCVVARLRGVPVGCGALKLHGTEPAEIKRMWVDPGSRGLGVGRRVLDSLEKLARENGVGVLRLETNRALREAMGLYRVAGFEEVAPFNDEPHAHHWFEKTLSRTRSLERPRSRRLACGTLGPPLTPRLHGMFSSPTAEPVVVPLWWMAARHVRACSRRTTVVQVKREWRDPGSNRGHHIFWAGTVSLRRR